MSRALASIGLVISVILFCAAYAVTGNFGFQRATAHGPFVSPWHTVGGLAFVAGLVFLALVIRGPRSPDP